MPLKNNVVSLSRIQVIDALRAFALLGIIINHTSGEYIAGPPVDGYSNQFGAIDRVVGMLTEVLTFGKFFTIFSFLFGLSFAIQVDNASGRGEKLTGRFFWRLVILFVIGFTHSLFYSGDILRIYAILGLILLACQKLGNRALLVMSVFLVLNGPLLIARVASLYDTPPTSQQIASQQKQGAEFMKNAASEFNIKRYGSVGEVITMNVTGGLVGTLFFQVISGRLFVTLGLFLLGMLAGRKKIFQGSADHVIFFKKVFAWSGAMALVSTTLAILYNPGFAPGPSTWLRILGATAADVQQASLSVFYVACFTLLFWRRPTSMLAKLVPAGQMGLTVYLTQTMFGLLLFYGFGLGMMGKIGISVGISLALIFYAFQIVACNAYMKRFRYGPVEWFWRSATFLKIQPI